MKRLLEPGSFTHRVIMKLARYRITPSLLLPFGRELNPERWIFVVGCYNSGTTLLSRILEEHPLIGGLPDEGVYFTDSLPIPEPFGWTRMWCKCLEKVQINPNATSKEVADRIKKQWSLWFPKDIPNLLEKSPANCTRTLFLQQYFQPAYFIYIVRNGYAVAEGIRRKANLARWKNPEFVDRYPLDLCAQQWKAVDELVGRDQTSIHRFKQVYYEDLTSQPNAVIRELTDFLELPNLDKDLCSSSWSVHEKHSAIRNMNPDSFSRLSESDLDVIEATAGDYLNKHKYKRPELGKNKLS